MSMMSLALPFAIFGEDYTRYFLLFWAENCKTSFNQKDSTSELETRPHNQCTGHSKCLRNKIKLLLDHVYKQKKFFLIHFPKYYHSSSNFIDLGTHYIALRTFYRELFGCCQAVAKRKVFPVSRRSLIPDWFSQCRSNAAAELAAVPWLTAAACDLASLDQSEARLNASGPIRGSTEPAAWRGYPLAAAACSQVTSSRS